MNRFFRFFLIFTVIWFGLSLLLPKPPTDEGKTDLSVVLESNEITQGTAAVVRLRNNLDTVQSIGEKCPAEEAISVQRFANGVWENISKTAEIPCQKQILQPHVWVTISFAEYMHKLFPEMGTYQIVVPMVVDGVSKQFSADLTVEAPGMFKQAWNLFFYRPIYNALIYLSSVANMSLGLGIVFLTIILRFLLLGPSIKAMRSQKMMQKVQPELNAIRAKYKNDQARIATETMAIWKKHKIHPMSAFTPILIQMPILIALFFVVQEGLTSNNLYLLYEPMKHIPLTQIQTLFLGFEMTKVDIFVLPVVVGLAQFLQMKLAMAKQPKSTDDSPMAMQMAMAGKMMVYFLPLMIAVFSATLPAAVAIYWIVSALFSVVQQLWVNKFV